MQQVSDQDLVKKILAGEHALVEVLFWRYEQRVIRYAVSLVGDHDDAQDVVQEAFIKAFRSLQAYDQRRPFSPWLYRIVRNQALNWKRNRRRVFFGEIAQELLNRHPDNGLNPLEEIEKKDIQNIVRNGLKTISRPYREVLTLYYLDEMSYTEISDILRIPEGTVANRLYRAKGALRTIIKKGEEQ